MNLASVKSERDLVFLGDRKLVERLPNLNGTKAIAIVARELRDEASESLTEHLSAAIISPRPRHALATVSAYLPRRQGIWPQVVHASATIDPTATIGEGCVVGAGAVIGADVCVGDGTAIHPNVTIAAGAVIGSACIVHSGVSIADGVTIGDRVRIHHNAVIGGDGFSFETEEASPAERAKAGGASIEEQPQSWARIESYGTVEIGDDVEVGCGTTIDRASFGATIIGSGTKIDNLVQIGHNCRIGEDCLICSQVGIAGSTTLGNGCVLAGKVGVADHLVIGDHVAVMAKSGITKNLEGGAVYYGMPARPVKDTLRIYSQLTKLSDMRQRLARLERELNFEQS